MQPVSPGSLHRGEPRGGASPVSTSRGGSSPSSLGSLAHFSDRADDDGAAMARLAAASASEASFWAEASAILEIDGRRLGWPTVTIHFIGNTERNVKYAVVLTNLVVNSGFNKKCYVKLVFIFSLL